jgi:hypothetical protein
MSKYFVPRLRDALAGLHDRRLRAALIVVGIISLAYAFRVTRDQSIVAGQLCARTCYAGVCWACGMHEFEPIAADSPRWELLRRSAVVRPSHGDFLEGHVHAHIGRHQVTIDLGALHAAAAEASRTRCVCGHTFGVPLLMAAVEGRVFFSPLVRSHGEFGRCYTPPGHDHLLPDHAPPDTFPAPSTAFIWHAELAPGSSTPLSADESACVAWCMFSTDALERGEWATQ